MIMNEAHTVLHTGLSSLVLVTLVVSIFFLLFRPNLIWTYIGVRYFQIPFGYLFRPFRQNSILAFFLPFPRPKICIYEIFVVSLQQNLTLVKCNFRLVCIAEVLRLQGVLDHAYLNKPIKYTYTVYYNTWHDI